METTIITGLACLLIGGVGGFWLRSHIQQVADAAAEKASTLGANVEASLKRAVDDYIAKNPPK